MVLATPRILISDDDAALRRVLAESLATRGFEVTVTGDGGEAIDVWDSTGGRFQLCLVDFHMPRANGLEVIRHVQSTATATGRPACVLMSADLTDAIRTAAVEARVHQVLAKPLRIKTLGEVIREALRSVTGGPAFN